jgi:putative Mg2+ transporter-C (MgtC) family protein
MSTREVVLRILIAAVLAGVIGLEREIREHTAGFRTHILVGVGSAAFTLASYYVVAGTTSDPTRIAAQIVTGIGFLGAGAIVRYGATVKGLTTAASLWTVAAVGLLAGQGFYSAALITTGLVILSLYVLRLIERRLLYPVRGEAAAIRVHFRKTGYAPLVELVTLLQQSHIELKEIALNPEDDAADTLHLRLKLPRGVTPQAACATIAVLPEVETVSVE